MPGGREELVDHMAVNGDNTVVIETAKKDESAIWENIAKGLGTGSFILANLHHNIIRPLLAEFIAVAFFVFFGCGSVILNKTVKAPNSEGYCGPSVLRNDTVDPNGSDGNFWPSENDPCPIKGVPTCLAGVDVIAIALCFGLAIIVLVYMMAKISGAHINPAVTLCTMITGDMPIILGLFYMLAQCSGAVFGGVLLMSVYPKCEGDMVNWGATGVDTARGFTVGQGLMCEILLTFSLCMTVLYTAVSKDGMGNLAPIAIGLCVLIDHIVGIEVTGASMNPARSLGSAFISGYWDNFEIYIFGPAIGSILAAVMYLFILKHTVTNEKNAPPTPA